MSNPRPDQADVIAYRGGAVAVAAVPGAGKTFVLKELAARLIEDKLAAPSQLLMLTYMRTGALNLRERIQAELAARGRSASGLRVMTIHAFCHQLLSRHAGHLLGDEQSLISDAERWMLLSLGLERFLADRDNFDDWRDSWATADLLDQRADHLEKLQGYAVSAAADAISAMKAFRLPLETAVRVVSGQGFVDVAYLLRFYSEEMRRRQLWDYDDLVSEAIGLLEAHPALAEKYQRQYRYVLEDEAQDSTFAQQRLMGLLTAGHGNLLRVGDTNQAILSTFTFNDPKFFRDFLHNARRLPLEESGRSAPRIQALANRLIRIGLAHPQADRVNAFEDQTLKPSSVGQRNPADEAGAIRFECFRDVASQDRAVVAGVQRYLATLDLETETGPVIGILTRRNDRAEAIGKALAEVGIQAWVPGRPAAESNLALEILAGVVRFLCLPTKSAKGEGLLRLIWRILSQWQTFRKDALENPAAFKTWIDDLDKRHQAMRFVYPALTEAGLPARPPEVAEADYARLLDLCELLRELLRVRHRPLVEVIAFACERLFASTGAILASHCLALALRREYVRNPDMDLDAACDFIEDLVRKSRKGALIPSTFEEDGPKPPVMVTTVHKSKGMEFDTVFVVDVTANTYAWDVAADVTPRDLDWRRGRITMRALETFALTGTVPDPHEVVRQANFDEVGEGLRLLYVAVTRAQRRLFITSHREGPWPNYRGAVGWPLHVRKLAEGLDAQN